MTKPGRGAGRLTGSVFQLIIEMGVFGWNFRFSDGVHLRVSQLLDAPHAAVPLLEPLIFLDRQHNQPIAAVARDRHRLGQRLVRQRTISLEEFSG
jgi:hypothetical protein